MKKILSTLALLVMVLVGCTTSNKNEQSGKLQQVAAAPSVDSARSTRQFISFSDPCFYGGSTILNYFFSLLRASDYARAVDRLTSKSSIHKFGRITVLEYYKSIKIDYSPVLLSVVRHGMDSSNLKYKVNVMATIRYVDVQTILEDDTARILLPDSLQNFLR